MGAAGLLCEVRGRWAAGRCPADPCSGARLQFEAQRGNLLSEAVAAVALPNEAAVAEAQQAQRALAGARAACPGEPAAEAGPPARGPACLCARLWRAVAVELCRS